jgi:hypothetical protein
MQTFLPYPDFAMSARALDNKRLGKQRVECKQIARALGLHVGGAAKSKAWANHPAVRMWRGHEFCLLLYAIACCLEWRRRGFRDTLLRQFQIAAAVAFLRRSHSPPPWLGDDYVHRSHRSNLLRKDPDYYLRHNWTEPDTLPYVWPA